MANDIVDLDLNDLAPKAKTIQFGEQTIELLPPRLSTLIVITQIGRRLQGGEADQEIESIDKLDKLEDQLREAIAKVAPGLDVNKLGITQLLALTEQITEMAEPAQMKALAEKGIAVEGQEKKVQSD